MVLRYGHFSNFVGDRMTNLTSNLVCISKLSPFEVHISKHQLAKNRPDATFGQEH